MCRSLEYEYVKPNKDANLKNINGKRIVDIAHFIAEVRSLERHICNVKSSGYLAFDHEVHEGFNSSLVFKCTACYETKAIKTNADQHSSNINYALTWGTIACGKGYSTMQDIFSMADVPVFSNKTYAKYQQIVGEVSISNKII